MEMKNLKLDENGHLLDYKQWNRDVGEYLAKEDGMCLNKDHWLIIILVRDIYLQSKTSAPMRLLIKAIKKANYDQLASSRSLYQLFPDGPVRLACKYAGLPKPKHCL